MSSSLKRAVPLGLCAAAVALVLAAGSSSAATGTVLYVDGASAACSDSGSGTSGQPFCTIGAAAGKVTAGQTVQVAAGTYREAVTVPTSGTSTAPITFTTAPGATVTVTGKDNGFVISGRSWITVTGFDVTRTNRYGIWVSNASHITLSRNHVSYSGQPVSGLAKSGIRLNNVSDSEISGNTVDHNTKYGIYFTSSTRNTVKGNESFSNAQGYQRAASGIRFYSSPGNTAIANICHDNEDSGIEFDVGSSNSLVANNVTYGNGDHGLDNRESTGQRLIGNTVYKNVTAGIQVEGTSTGATLANNIAVDNGIASPRAHGNIRVDKASTAGTSLDYDLVFLSVADTMIIWNSVSYKSLSAFQAATGQEAHGIEADPRWRNRAAWDFHLSAGSPAIDSANSGASGQPSTDADGNGRVDDPATPNTGAGPRAYDDRGAYELQLGTADQPPSAALTVTPASGTAPLNVTADASGSFDGDATPIATYAFDFGDGTAIVGPQAAATAAHTYTAAGTYTITVTVTDTAGLSSTMTASVEVTAPSADAPPNLVGNPGFETALTGWNTSGSITGVTLSRVSGGHSGSWSAKLVNGSTSAGTCRLNDSPNWVGATAAGTYNASIWVRGDTAGATLKLKITEYSGTTNVGSAASVVTLTTSWQKVSLLYTAVAPGSSKLDLHTYISGAPPGTCFSADDAAIFLT